jgi:hypothetical protein
LAKSPYFIKIWLKSPREERLLTSGWNDTAFFYGNNESYMTVPRTIRERKLHHSATVRRGFPLVNGSRDKDDQIEGEQYVNALITHDDEDEYLTSSGISYLENLTLHLINTTPEQLQKLGDPFDLIGVTEKRISRAFETFELLQNYITPMDIPERITLFSKMEPEFDVIQEVKCEPVWFLDYLPMLRDICISEKHAECIFQATLQAAGDAITSTNRKFNTRRSSKRGRKHYLEEIVPKFVWDTFNTTAMHIGMLIAHMSLPNERSALKSKT